MNINFLWAVEYNQQKQTFYVSTVENVVRENRKRILYGEVPNRMLFGIFSTSEEAYDAVRRIRGLLQLEARRAVELPALSATSA